MSRNSTPSPPIIVKKKQNSVANVARSFVRQQENTFMNLNDIVKNYLKIKNGSLNNINKEITSTSKQVYKNMDNFIRGTSVSGIKLKARANPRRSKRTKTKK